MKWKWFGLNRKQFYLSLAIFVLLMIGMTFVVHLTALAGIQIVGAIIFAVSIPIVYFQVAPRIAIKIIK